MKGKWMRKGLLHIILITFLFTGFFPTPLYAAEALKEGAVALSRAESSSKHFAQSILGISPPLVQSTKDEKGLLDSIIDFFTSDESDEKKRGQALENSTLPANQKAPVGKKEASPKKVRELTEKRTKNAKFYELSDGRIQAETQRQRERRRHLHLGTPADGKRHLPGGCVVHVVPKPGDQRSLYRPIRRREQNLYRQPAVGRWKVASVGIPPLCRRDEPQRCSQ